MYVLGGWSDRRNIAMSSVLKFNSTQGTWSQVAPMPEAIYLCAACAIEGNIYIFGGRSPDRIPQPSVYKYETVSNEWITLAPMPRACNGLSVVVMNGLVYIVGAGEQVRGVLRWDPASNVWSTLGSTLDLRQHGCAFVLDGCIYAAGGNKSNSSNMERYDAATNIWTAVADMLERRYFAAVTIGTAGPAEEQDLFDALIAQASSRRP
jgi:N-acetylneuraminic acid mutarotase